MRRNVLAGFVFVGILVWTIARVMSPQVSEQAASMQAPHVAQGGLPQFQLDPNFPKVPAKWRMGFGSDVAIDETCFGWQLVVPGLGEAYDAQVRSPNHKLRLQSGL